MNLAARKCAGDLTDRLCRPASAAYTHAPPPAPSAAFACGTMQRQAGSEPLSELTPPPAPVIGMLIRIFPECRQFLDNQSRSSAWKRAWTDRGYQRYSSPLRQLLAVGIVAALFTSLLMARKWGLIAPGPLLFSAMATCGASCLGALVLYWTPLRRALRRELVLTGVDVCIPCGYDLRGRDGECCPECGTQRQTREQLHAGADSSMEVEYPLPRSLRPAGQLVGRFCYWLSRPIPRSPRQRRN